MVFRARNDLIYQFVIPNSEKRSRYFILSGSIDALLSNF